MLDVDELKKLGYRIKARENAAFHVLYVEYFASMQVYAQRFVYNYQDAQDIVQDAFFALWTNVHLYDPRQSIVAYLLRIVRNNCLNYLRALKIRDEHKDKIIEAMIFSGMQDNNTDDELQSRLHKVLASLPEKGYQVLIAHILEHKKLKEIAGEMGIAESSVKTHLKRAIRVLREHFCFILFGI